MQEGQLGERVVVKAAAGLRLKFLLHRVLTNQFWKKNRVFLLKLDEAFQLTEFLDFTPRTRASPVFGCRET